MINEKALKALFRDQGNKNLCYTKLIILHESVGFPKLYQNGGEKETLWEPEADCWLLPLMEL